MHSTVDARSKLIDIAESTLVPIGARAAAADELGMLGDLRLAPLDRIAVPAGDFRFSRGNRGQEGEVFVSAFEIDRYPVTVAAFTEFLEAGGYSQRALWSARGWAWRLREEIV